MIQQELFYKRFGVRLPQHLVSPIMPTLETFEFPKTSIWHYITFDTIENGPSSSDYLLRDIQKKIFVQHVLDLTNFEGNPREVSGSFEPYVREFHIRNKRFRRSLDITEAPTDENTLGIVNYALLPSAYRYVRSFYKEYYNWINIQKTVWQNVKTIAGKSERTQYVFVDLPKTLPSLQRLDLACGKFDQTTLKFFPNAESLFLLELWKWLSEDYRSVSIFGGLTTEECKKVNVVVKDSGRWFVVNLGVLDEWRYVKGVSDDKQKIKIDPIQMQKRFLRGAMTMMENRTVANVLDEEDPNEVVPDTTIEVAQVDEDQTKHDQVNKILENMDSDLHQLEVIEKANDSDHHEESATLKAAKSVIKDKDIDPVQFDTIVTPQAQIKITCDKLADDGLLSGAEYRKFIKQLEKLEELESPVPGVKLVEYAKIKPETLKIEKPTTIKDIITVPDKSMLESSLFDFDKNYVTKVMSKDIASMGLATQKAGFVITNYEVEKIEDVLGKYENHTLRISPIEGVPSTLRFKLPTVDESGEYKVGGVTYRMRKQRGDLPIRKVTPSRVSLTSYYGKTFVTRNEKKVNNYGTWLHDHVMSASLQEDTKITNLKPSNVFDNLFKCPRAYSMMAQHFSGLTVNGYDLYFDHTKREEVFGLEALKKYEKSGSILFGLSADGKHLVMDNNNVVYTTDTGSLVPVGTIENFLGIDAQNSPVEFSEVKIYGKTIPVGVVLGYKLGLDKLMTMLKVSPRRVNAGQRLNLQDHEYSIVFSDETLILSKEDRLAAMILSGFREYERATKNFSVYNFDKTGVYLNVLEQFNISARYLREIDLIDAMFVDPIAEELLKEMNEPITFRGLLVRASELLLTDQHPHALDMQHMRIKGYERFAGAMYTEIVNSVREHRSRVSRSNYPIDLHPYAVWKRITQDPSIGLVNDINPIQNLKEAEAVTYGGVGGRNSRSMTRDTREFHPSDMGVISESTSDSSDVGINTYTSANPNFTSVRGATKRFDMKDPKASSLLSTSALISVGSDRDD